MKGRSWSTRTQFVYTPEMAEREAIAAPLPSEPQRPLEHHLEAASAGTAPARSCTATSDRVELRERSHGPAICPNRVDLSEARWVGSAVLSRFHPTGA